MQRNGYCAMSYGTDKKCDRYETYRKTDGCQMDKAASIALGSIKFNITTVKKNQKKNPKTDLFLVMCC